jgi:HK97 family phage prohead protease
MKKTTVKMSDKKDNTKKDSNIIKYKSMSDDSISISKDNMIVEGYFAAFNNIDSDGEVFTKGAFAKSIMEHGPGSVSNRKIAHLAYHDVTRPIGKIIELIEDDYGLRFKSEMGTHQEGKDFLEMYKSKIIGEHSVGFNYMLDKILRKTSPEGVVYDQLSEVKLWEGSAVVFGANENTPNLTEIKTQKDLTNVLDKINIRMETFIKAVQDKNISTKYNELFAIELQQLKDSYVSLIQRESFDDTQIETKSEASEEEKDSLKRNFHLF